MSNQLFHGYSKPVTVLSPEQGQLVELNSGSLNQNPLPFETTMKVIREGQNINEQAKHRPHGSSLDRLTRNLTGVEKSRVEMLICNEQVFVDQLAKTLNAAKWEDPLLTHPRFGQYAYNAYKQEKISLAQMVTLFLRWAATEQFKSEPSNLKRYPIFDGEMFSREAQTFLLPALWEMDSRQLLNLKERLKRCPSSEQSFWMVKIPESLESFGFLKQLQDVFYLFQPHRILSTDELYFVVPSFSILQAYLNAVMEEDAVTIVPEFGVATPSQIEMDIPQNKRVIALHFPGVQGLEEGDGYRFGKFLSSIHDFYHCHRVSLIPYNHRLAYLRVAHVFKHCQMLAKQHPHNPLLSVYWSKQQCAWRSERGTVKKFEHLNQSDCEAKFHQLIDLDYPASDGYVHAFRTPRVFPYSITPRNTFKPFSHSFYWIDAGDPKKVTYVAIVLHDMVTHSKQWHRHFGIDAFDPNRWKESPGSPFKIQGHLIKGFTKLQARL